MIRLTLKYTGPDSAEVKIVAKNVEYNLGVLQPGELFTINGTKDDGKFEKNDLDIYFDGVKQDVKIHVSCSQPIGEGVVFTFDGGRALTVVESLSRDNPTLAVCPLVDLAALGDFVWEDLNGDGLQDTGEPGVEGVTVNLLDPNNAYVVLETTSTDVDGLYGFSGLLPGDYVVEFVLPDGFVFSAKDAGDDTLDSDADTTTGKTDTLTLAEGEENLTVDAGMGSVCLFDTGPPEIDYAGTFDLATETGTVTITVTDDTGLASVDLTSFEAFGDLSITLDCTDDFFVGTKQATYVCSIPDPSLFYFVTVVATDLCGKTPDCPSVPYHPVDNPDNASKPPLVYGPGLSNGIFPIFVEARGALLKAVDVFLLVDAGFADSTVTEIPGPEFTFDPGVADFQFDLVKTGGGFRWGFLAADQCNATIADPESGDPVSIRSDRAVNQTLSGALSGAVVEELPQEFALNQNYPNPFNPTTQIRFDLPEASRVTLAVYDVLGRRVMTLANGRYEPGRYSVTFDGQGLSSGMYFYRLITDRQSFTKTMILQK
ncbi:SdrD B-like domain-containing protein [Rhodocaloribacter sp.]